MDAEITDKNPGLLITDHTYQKLANRHITDKNVLFFTSLNMFVLKLNIYILKTLLTVILTNLVLRTRKFLIQDPYSTEKIYCVVRPATLSNLCFTTEVHVQVDYIVHFSIITKGGGGIIRFSFRHSF